MSSAGKRAALTHLHPRGARRRLTAAGLAAIAGATFSAPLLFSTRVGAAPDDPPTTTTVLSIPTTTDTIVTTTTTTAPTTTIPVVLPPVTTTTVTTTTAPPIVTTTTAATAVGGQEIVQLGGDATPVTLAQSARSVTAAAQLPRTGAAPTLPTLTGIALLIAGALASTTKRRRQMGVVRIKSRRRS
jgi:LPXTG-motif cell wall-anchored protein